MKMISNFSFGKYIDYSSDITNKENIIHIRSWQMADIRCGERKEVDRCLIRKNALRELTIEFAVAVSDVCEEIKGVSIYVNQLVRASSSIGANIHEARYAQSRADFISKLEIALKETSETEYWLELIYRKHKFTEEQYRTSRNMCGTIHRMLIASVTTAKANRV